MDIAQQDEQRQGGSKAKCIVGGGMVRAIGCAGMLAVGAASAKSTGCCRCLAANTLRIGVTGFVALAKGAEGFWFSKVPLV